MLVAAAATAFFSCQKQEVVAPENEQVSCLTFTSEKPAFADETKTEWTGETIQWSKGDKIRIAYTCDDVWQNADGTATASEDEGCKTAKFYPSTELAEASNVAQFDVPGKFVGNADGEYVFYGIYPSSVVGSSDMKNAPSFNIILPSVQTPLADSFDPESDVMVAQSASYIGMPEEAISMRWERQVAHAYITLKEINSISDDEQVLSVKITAQDAANMVGMQKYNMATGEFVQHEDNAAANVLEINGANLSVENGNIVFWASFLPCTWASFTVEVNTDKATYTREVESCSLEFKQNARNTLAIKMDKCDVEARVAEVTATLTFDSTSKRTEYSTSKQVWVESGITLTNNKASSTNNVADYAKPARFYANSSIVLEAPGNITSIIFDCNESSHATVLKNSIGSTATASSDKVTVSLASAVEVFTISKLTAQVRMDAVTVTYQTAGGSSENPDTTPELNVTETALQIDYVEASAHVSVSTKNLYDIEANAFADADCTTDCEWLAAEWTPEGISYAVSENETDELRVGYIQIVAFDSEGNEYSEVISISQATSYIAELTIEEFLEKDVNPYMWYQLTGVMSNIVEGNAFGNFNITDETGTVYVYGLTATKKSSNDQSFNSLGLRNGDELTLIGTRSVYGSNAQVGGPAYYVDHVAAPYIDVKPSTTITVDAEATEATFTVESNIEWDIECEDANDYSVEDGTVTINFSANESEDEMVYEVKITSDELDDVVVTIKQAAASQGDKEPDPITIIIDGSTLTFIATTADSNHTFGGVTFTMSKGAKYQKSSKATNAFSTNAAILIGKSGAYIYNKTAIPGRITKFEIYSNEGASAKVSVGVNFSSTEITKYSASASNTYTATLSTTNKVYDCSDKLPSDAKYFWYQVTNSNNSQVQFRITYIPEN